MNETRPQVPGWHPDPDVPGGTAYWDGQRWTGDRRPPRLPFAAQSAHPIWGWVSLVFGALMVLSAPGQLFQAESESPIAGFFGGILIGAGLVALGVYLVRGRGPSTKSVTDRLEAERREATLREVAAPPPPPAPVVVRVSTGPSQPNAEAAQVNAIANPETAKALKNLQHLLYTRVITDAEFEAAKAKLFGGNGAS